MTGFRVPARGEVNCPGCGRRMSRFLNPERYICSYLGNHAAVSPSPPPTPPTPTPLPSLRVARVGDRHSNTGRSRPRRRPS